MAASCLLMAVHLNDNGITRNLDQFIEVLDLFNLKLDDVGWRRLEPMAKESWYQDPHKMKYFENEKTTFDGVKEPLDISKRIEKYMRFKPPSKEEEENDSDINYKRIKHKAHLLIS